MLIARVRPRLVAGDQAIVDMPPVIGRGVRWIDVERFDNSGPADMELAGFYLSSG